MQSNTKTKLAGLVGGIAQGVVVLGVLGGVVLAVSNGQELGKVATDVAQLRNMITQAGQSQLPVAPDEVRSIMARPDGDCLKAYVQTSLAAGQIVLRGQVQQGSGLDACQLASALELQKQALVIPKVGQPD